MLLQRLSQQTRYVFFTWRHDENKVNLIFYVKETCYSHGKMNSPNDTIYMFVMFLMVILYAMKIYKRKKCIIMKSVYVTHNVICTKYSRREDLPSIKLITCLSCFQC